MDKHILKSAFVVALLAFTAGSAMAQTLRPERTFYLTPKVGISNYVGDNDTTPFDFEDWGVDNEFYVPWLAGLEAGYQISTRFSLSGEYQIANYPSITNATTTGVSDFEDRVRHTGLLWLRWTAMADRARVAPFLQIGLGGTARGDEIGWGPAGGLGLDFALSNRTSLILEYQAKVATPDGAVDFTEGDGFSNDIDLLNSLSLGLKFNFRSAFTPAQILALECPPANVTAGQAASFTATTNSDAATPPVTYSWNFGDGGSASGTVVTHTFNQPGNYTVTFTAANGDHTVSRTCPVNVVPAPVAAAIVTATANPMTFDVCEDRTVQFSANARGDEPVTYTWDFGDGTTGTGATASHVYREVGTYTVTLTATNAIGSDTRSITVTAEACRTGVCYEVTEMNSVFFNRNASTLTNEARAALQENLEILQECPNLCARIEGFAGPGERNAQQLSDDRARAVQQFYIDNGVAASRLTPTGRGLVSGTTSKKEDSSQFRRADTIPMQCEDMR